MTRLEAKRKTLHDQPSYREQSAKNETRRIMDVQSLGTPSTDKNTQCSEQEPCNIVDPVTNVSSGSDADFNSTLMDLGQYYHIYYTSNLGTPECRYISDPDKFVESDDCIYQLRLGIEKGLRRLNPVARPTWFPRKLSLPFKTEILKDATGKTHFLPEM